MLRPREFHNLKQDGAARGRWYPALLKQLAARRVAGGGAKLNLPKAAEAFDARNASLRPIFEFKTKLFGAAKVAPTVGTFPIAEVSNGHTFFVRCEPPPRTNPDPNTKP